MVQFIGRNIGLSNEGIDNEVPVRLYFYTGHTLNVSYKSFLPH